MILNEDSNQDTYQIRAYSVGAITVNEEVYHQSIIISAHTLITHWKPQSLDTLENDDFAAILMLKPELVILGTGLQFKLPPAKQLAPLYQHKIKIECMDTGAACRTYMVLASEKRNVVAALLIK